MGKKLIIKGADFSANGITTPVDITDSFVWTNARGLTADADARFVSSSTFKAVSLENGVDISNYVGRTMRMAIPRYNTSQGIRASFGHIIQNEDGVVLWSYQMPKYSESTSVVSQGDVIAITAIIPEGAKIIRATFFADGSEWITQPFECVIL